MTNNARVTNVTRGYTLKHSQALRAISNCAAAWVEFGVSIRDLTLAESVAARHAQAKLREPLPQAEVPGVIYQPSRRGAALTRQGYALIREANALITA